MSARLACGRETVLTVRNKAHSHIHGDLQYIQAGRVCSAVYRGLFAIERFVITNVAKRFWLAEIGNRVHEVEIFRDESPPKIARLHTPVDFPIPTCARFGIPGRELECGGPGCSSSLVRGTPCRASMDVKGCPHAVGKSSQDRQARLSYCQRARIWGGVLWHCGELNSKILMGLSTGDGTVRRAPVPR